MAMRDAVARNILYGDSVRLVTAPYDRRDDVVEFGRGSVECPNCGSGEGGRPNDAARMTCGDLHVLWCSCGTVWIDASGAEIIVGDFSDPKWKDIIMGKGE